jgi:hypothetical protein
VCEDGLFIPGFICYVCLDILSQQTIGQILMTFDNEHCGVSNKDIGVYD